MSAAAIRCDIFHIGSGANNQSKCKSREILPGELMGKTRRLRPICRYIEAANASGRMNLNSIKQGMLAFRRPAGGTPARSGFASAIGGVTQELETLNRSTERDFLAVGEKLREFRAAARQIQSDMAAVTELISGEQGRNASQALAQMLERSKDMDTRIENSGQALTGVSELSVQLRRAFSGLPNMVSVFRALCTLTRIETSRLGSTGADLGHLAAEIIPLSESIQASGKGVMESSFQLDQKVQSALQRGAELRITQLKEMPALIASVLDSLRLFEERRHLALESSERQAAQYAEVCAAIDDLVGSIQFHDITRQQVEHVIEALRHVRASSGSPDIRAILALQSSQLAGAAGLSPPPSTGCNAIWKTSRRAWSMLPKPSSRLWACPATIATPFS